MTQVKDAKEAARQATLDSKIAKHKLGLSKLEARATKLKAKIRRLQALKSKKGGLW